MENAILANAEYHIDKEFILAIHYPNIRELTNGNQHRVLIRVRHLRVLLLDGNKINKHNGADKKNYILIKINLNEKVFFTFTYLLKKKKL